eukprot:TRINITY_DN18925_c0_g1_i1.p1 TRINITY_DN18925_c0_g1~~TRINITY_DN18925_c0_g1_i1.p1  ORF type:complete len:923 (+),score=166.75 TRINITY_DN18925_c0_g1_i1:112-2880(+)
MANGKRYVLVPGEGKRGDASEESESNESGRGGSKESKSAVGSSRRFHGSEKVEEIKEPKPVGFFDFFQHMRTSLQGTEWYSSLAAWRIRSIMTGTACTTIMLCALMTALLLPDLSQILDFPHNVWTDLIMSVSMCIFLCELIALSLTDVHYLFSFFHLMDVIGTTSMIFDISFLLGAKANEPAMASKNSAQKRIMLLRASRAARVGARAGRLTRVLRVCKFVADFGDDDKGKPMDETKVEKTSIANVISVKLSNLLATRVASLTIFLVMVMPLFEVMNFPQKDLSLVAWVDQVTAVHREDETATVAELQKMAEFFSVHSYGPFAACAGQVRGEGEFICEKYYEDWGQVQTEPARRSFVLMVHTPDFLVRFNMARPLKVKAFLDLLNCFFTILIMVVFGVALSTVVTDLAVTPLERMLGTVREMANTVFRFSSNLSSAEKDEQPEDLTDIDSAGEMVLLEKVVEKLASIALVQTQQDAIEDTDGLQEDDIGVLSMLKGTELKGSQRSTAEETSVGRKGSRKIRPTPTLSTEVHGVDEDTYNSLSTFDVFILSPLQLNKLAYHALVAHPSGIIALSGEEGEDQLLQRFILTLQKGYNPNPFHNFAHALDVLAGVVRMLKLVEADTFLSDLEQFSILVAALGHDLGHPGQNNGFLSEVSHELAIRYNDMSPLENMHCSKLYQILGKPETAIFRLVSTDEYKEVRKVIVETILHTDMIGHQPLVKDLNLIYQVHQEVFRSSLQAAAPTMAGGRRKTVRRPDRVLTRSKVMPKEATVTEPSEIFGMPENKMLIMNTILHSADVSNPARGWEVSKKWADVCIEEFFQQGDQEKALGIPVQFLNDRENLNRPNSQIGFIEFMIAPFFAAQIWLWPILFEYGENLSNNIGYWQDMWEEQTKPSQEDLDKVRNRVAKVRETLSCAAMRIMS